MKRGRRRVALAAAGALLVGVGIGIAATAAGVRVTRVVSASMSPAVHRGDWVVTRELDQNGRDAIGRQDVVLFRFPLGTAGHAVKRVVAIERDRIAIGARSVTVNGRVIPTAGAPSPGAARRRVETVPEDHVFLLGDNAAVSIDSRSVGPVPEAELVGRVLFVIPKRAPQILLGLAAAIVLVVVGVLVARRRSQDS